MAIQRIQTVYLTADDVTKTANFYETMLGAPRFRDGAAWVQFGVGGVGFAVASRAEGPLGAVGATIVFETDDPADHDRLLAVGAVAIDARDMGDHGRTRTYRDPAGHIIQMFWRT